MKGLWSAVIEHDIEIMQKYYTLIGYIYELTLPVLGKYVWRKYII